jgi:hypothetical protein
VTIKLRIRNVKTGFAEIIDFETEPDALKWLNERPPFMDVMGAAGVVPVAMDLQARLKAAMRPLTEDERLADRELQLKLDKLDLDKQTESRKKDLENQAKHVETMRTGDPDRIMEIQWRFNADMKLTDPADPRAITEDARAAVLAFIAERNEWVARRGQCVGECTVKVWPGKLPAGKDERVSEGRFVPVSTEETK